MFASDVYLLSPVLPLVSLAIQMVRLPRLGDKQQLFCSKIEHCCYLDNCVLRLGLTTTSQTAFLNLRNTAWSVGLDSADMLLHRSEFQERLVMYLRRHEALSRRMSEMMNWKLAA